MNIAKELESLKINNAKINLLNSDIDKNYSLITRMRDVNSAMPAIDNLLKLNQELNSLIDNLYNDNQFILSLIEELPDDEKEIIVKYYIQGKTWDEIAKTSYKSKRTIMRLRTSAISIIESLIS